MELLVPQSPLTDPRLFVRGKYRGSQVLGAGRLVLDVVLWSGQGLSEGMWAGSGRRPAGDLHAGRG